MADKPYDETVDVTGEERSHPAYRLLARAMLTLARLKGSRETGDEPADQAEGKDPEAGNG